MSRSSLVWATCSLSNKEFQFVFSSVYFSLHEIKNVLLHTEPKYWRCNHLVIIRPNRWWPPLIFGPERAYWVVVHYFQWHGLISFLLIGLFDLHISQKKLCSSLYVVVFCCFYNILMDCCCSIHKKESWRCSSAGSILRFPSMQKKFTYYILESRSKIERDFKNDRAMSVC